MRSFRRIRARRAERFPFVRAALAAAVLGARPAVAAPAPADSVAVQAVSIRFAAQVGGQAFRCTERYAAIGTTRSTIEPLDFRFYVHNVRLVSASGAEVPVTLADNAWQHEGVALLDFEDQTGSCSGGTADTNAVITGTVPVGEYRALRFTLGLPFALNHRDAATAPAPFNYTSLWWNWNGGYKFARLDFASTGQPQGWFIHLGSTGCNAGSGSEAPTTCREPNTAEVALADFDITRHVVAADLGRLLAQSNVDANAGGARGCMSARSDPECPALLRAFGIGADAAQRFFSRQ